MINKNLKTYAITACIIMGNFTYIASANTNNPPALPLEIKQNLEQVQFQMDNQGYHETNNDYATFLLNLEHDHSVKKLPDFINVNGENDFLKDPKKLQIVDKKKLPTYVKKNEIIGSTPLGSWVKEKNGWSGYKLFFKKNNNLVCAYSYFNLHISGGKVLPSDHVKEYIKGKEASSEVKGSNQSGFVYSVSWFTPEEVKILDCAQRHFDKDQLERVRKYASLIEEANNSSK
ncbi:MAG: hypothetical protein P1U36_05790 [Legionellaceae bacterium]|nr:hypothetical protein [Legionellaceae bacterium]